MSQSGEKIKILIVEDAQMFRDALKNVLDTASDMQVVAEAGNSEEACSRLKEQEVDVMLLDISMPGKNGLEILADVTRDFPQVVVIILSMHTDEQIIALARAKGASAYLTKGITPQKLIETIRDLDPRHSESEKDALASGDLSTAH